MKIYALLCLFLINKATGQPVKLLPGKWKPGFVSITRFDNTRPAIAEQIDKNHGRILQLNIWYPSAGSGHSMHFADYIALAANELDSTGPTNLQKQKAIDNYFAWPASLGADQKQFNSFIDAAVPMQAYKNARWQQNKFPLVMLVNGGAADHAYLAEHLASHGYIVLQVPVKGTTSYELDYEEKGLESQVLDYEMALNIVGKEYPFCSGQFAVAGFSFGGQSSVALALRNKNIKAVISLDGGTGSAFGAKLLGRQAYYRASDINIPVLHLYNPADLYTDLHWFNEIPKASRFLVAMKNMQHGHFTSFGLLNQRIPGIMGKTNPDPGNGYQTVMALTQAFLDKSLQYPSALNSNFFNSQTKSHAWMNHCIVKTAIQLAGT